MCFRLQKLCQASPHGTETSTGPPLGNAPDQPGSQPAGTATTGLDPDGAGHVPDTAGPDLDIPGQVPDTVVQDDGTASPDPQPSTSSAIPGLTGLTRSEINPEIFITYWVSKNAGL